MWIWSESLSKDATDQAQKTSAVVSRAKCSSDTSFATVEVWQAPHLVSRIHAPADLSSSVILESPNGDLTIANTDLGDQRTERYPHGDANVLKSFLFPHGSCTFLVGYSNPPQNTLVAFLGIGERCRICISAVHKGGIERILDEELPLSSTVSFLTSLCACKVDG